MAKKLILLVVVLGVAACGTNKEMPQNSSNGSDYNRPSPCVCEQLDFDGRGFTWVG